MQPLSLNYVSRVCHSNLSADRVVTLMVSVRRYLFLLCFLHSYRILKLNISIIPTSLLLETLGILNREPKLIIRPTEYPSNGPPVIRADGKWRLPTYSVVKVVKFHVKGR